MSGLPSRVVHPKLQQRLLRRAIAGRSFSSSCSSSRMSSEGGRKMATPNAVAANASEPLPENEPLPQYALPREKMRTLVQLFHQTKDFITHDNLEDRIDEAFTGVASHAVVNERTFPELQKQLREMRQAPEFVRLQGIDRFGNLSTGLWSGTVIDDRLQRVRAALWGTMPGGGPDLDIVEEENEEIQSLLAMEEAMFGKGKKTGSKSRKSR